jgi:hypothetical protein
VKVASYQQDGAEEDLDQQKFFIIDREGWKRKALSLASFEPDREAWHWLLLAG